MSIFASGFLTKPCMHLLFIPIRAICTAHLNIFYFIAPLISGEECKSWRFSICNLHSPVISSRLGPNSFLGTLFWNTLSVFSSLKVRNQFSHPYKTTSSLVILSFWVFPVRNKVGLFVVYFKMLSGTEIKQHSWVEALVKGVWLKRKRLWPVEVIFRNFCCGCKQNVSQWW
jgi:hypothetical protein